MDVLSWVLAFLGGFLGGATARALTPFVSRRLLRRREQRFLRYVRVVLPKAKMIEVISISGTDRQALDNCERRLRDASRNL